MRTLLIVILSPAFDDLPRLRQMEKPIGIETFFPEPSIETFRMAILHGLAGSNIAQQQSSWRTPSLEDPRNKLRPVITSNLFRQPSFLREPFQDTNDP